MTKNYKRKLVGMDEALKLKEKQPQRLVKAINNRNVDEAVLIYFTRLTNVFKELSDYKDFVAAYEFHEVFADFESFISSSFANGITQLGEADVTLQWITDFPQSPQELKSLYEKCLDGGVKGEGVMLVLLKHIMYRKPRLKLHEDVLIGQNECIQVIWDIVLDNVDHVGFGLNSESLSSMDGNERGRAESAFAHSFARWFGGFTESGMSFCIDKLKSCDHEPNMGSITRRRPRVTVREMATTINYVFENEWEESDSVFEVIPRLFAETDELAILSNSYEHVGTLDSRIETMNEHRDIFTKHCKYIPELIAKIFEDYDRFEYVTCLVGVFILAKEEDQIDALIQVDLLSQAQRQLRGVNDVYASMRSVTSRVLQRFDGLQMGRMLDLKISQKTEDLSLQYVTDTSYVVFCKPIDNIDQLKALTMGRRNLKMDFRSVKEGDCIDHQVITGTLTSNQYSRLGTRRLFIDCDDLPKHVDDMNEVFNLLERRDIPVSIAMQRGVVYSTDAFERLVNDMGNYSSDELLQLLDIPQLFPSRYHVSLCIDAWETNRIGLGQGRKPLKEYEIVLNKLMAAPDTTEADLRAFLKKMTGINISLLDLIYARELGDFESETKSGVSLSDLLKIITK